MLSLVLLLFFTPLYALPTGFVYLREHAPTISQDIRYAGFHNFVGRPIRGYKARECILTEAAAQALAKVQKALNRVGLSLKVYDCYRPLMASDDFLVWSKEINHQKMKAEFYPNVEKQDFFRLGYVAEKSAHNRGSTVDLTLISQGSSSAPYHPGQPLYACTAPYAKRYRDNSVDMGTGYDCMDKRSHVSNHYIGVTAFTHRILLRHLMVKYGFVPYNKEWWHFTLKSEPYPDQNFNFVVKKPSPHEL